MQEIKNDFRTHIPKESADSIKMCLTVSTVLHTTQTGASSFLKIKECIK